MSNLLKIAKDGLGYTHIIVQQTMAAEWRFCLVVLSLPSLLVTRFKARYSRAYYKMWRWFYPLGRSFQPTSGSTSIVLMNLDQKSAKAGNHCHEHIYPYTGWIVVQLLLSFRGLSSQENNFTCDFQIYFTNINPKTLMKISFSGWSIFIYFFMCQIYFYVKVKYFPGSGFFLLIRHVAKKLQQKL